MWPTPAFRLHGDGPDAHNTLSPRRRSGFCYTPSPRPWLLLRGPASATEHGKWRARYPVLRLVSSSRSNLGGSPSAGYSRLHRRPEPPGGRRPSAAQACRPRQVAVPGEHQPSARAPQLTGNTTHVRSPDHLDGAIIRPPLGPLRDFTGKSVASSTEDAPHHLPTHRSHELGNTAANNGWRHRGRELKQLLGRNNHAAYAEASGGNAVKCPELLTKPTHAADSAGGFGHATACNTFADDGDVRGLTRRITGGDGLRKRAALTEKASKELLEADAGRRRGWGAGSKPHPRAIHDRSYSTTRGRRGRPQPRV